MAESLVQSDWIVFQTTLRYPFITSDNPGFCMDENDRVYNLNFNEWMGFAFPLTPEYFLLIVNQTGSQKNNDNKLIHYRRAEQELVSILNRASFSVSYKRGLSNDKNTLLQVWQETEAIRTASNNDSNKN
ncbi:DUF4238 domain-containing protein [Spirosoma liriopis]|uniref:DUF4238 domain-containing protein n=1 Tax=Spirosoma liriopis TaxID=2937440 RepID=UPI00338E1420